jgi:predicted MFS family arabinose efflux permease
VTLTIKKGESAMASGDPPTTGLSATARPGEATGGFRRDGAVWASYLALATFGYFLSIQGDVISFLRADLALSYRAASLHPAALAAGLIVCGLFGERAMAWLGRDAALTLGLVGTCGGAALLSLAPTAAVSLAGCLLMGARGGLVVVVVPAALAERSGADRAIALGEANAATYAASLVATVATGLFAAGGQNWRSGLALGVELAAVALARCGSDPIPAATPRADAGAGRLPAAYWAYWATLFCVIALEQCTLLWGPEVLERVQGLPRAAAATAAGAFSAAMLTGRLSSAPLLRRVAAQRLFLASLALTLPGFLLYWGARQPAWSVVGLFLLGLGIALLYPLTLGFAIGAAGELKDAASARAALASGVAILSMPMALGALADALGLQRACLLLPALAAAASLCFAAARTLERRGSSK